MRCPQKSGVSTPSISQRVDEAVNIEEDDEAESKSLLHKHRCRLCNTSMDSYLLDETRKLHVCGNNPDCVGHEIEIGQYVIKGYEGPVLDCDKCHSEMQLKTGRFGKYFGCTGETSPGEPCKNTRKLLRNGRSRASQSRSYCNARMTLRKGRGSLCLTRRGLGNFFGGKSISTP